MQIGEILSSADVIADARFANKSDALDGIGTLLARKSGLAVDTVRQALRVREALGTTGIGEGIALPHAWMTGLDHPCAIFLRLVRPLQFDAVDQNPVDLICGLIGPVGTSTRLQMLASVARVLRARDRAQRIRRARDASEVYRLLTHDPVGQQPSPTDPSSPNKEGKWLS